MGPYDRLDVDRLAKHVGATIRPGKELVPREKLDLLEQIQPGAFSACTFDLDGRIVIVTNPLAELARRRSDVSHEVAHLLLAHQVKEVQQLGAMTFFTRDPDEEQEATWLAGCLLLPRELLLKSLRGGMTLTTSPSPTTSALRWPTSASAPPASNARPEAGADWY
jgi:Zn-dependent peptidase ImmA (M78 family)